MGAGFYIISILGCADGSAACTPVATLSTRYESRQSCEAAAPAALDANGDFDYPSLFAQCRPAKAPAAERAPRQTPNGARQG